jgi:hypothetical protein
VRRSTRRVVQLVESLGLRISKSDVSRVCQALDEHVGTFRTRPLEGRSGVREDLAVEGRVAVLGEPARVVEQHANGDPARRREARARMPAARRERSVEGCTASCTLAGATHAFITLPARKRSPVRIGCVGSMLAFSAARDQARCRGRRVERHAREWEEHMVANIIEQRADAVALIRDVGAAYPSGRDPFLSGLNKLERRLDDDHAERVRSRMRALHSPERAGYAFGQ